jgi:hypothetical protein
MSPWLEVVGVVAAVVSWALVAWMVWTGRRTRQVLADAKRLDAECGAMHRQLLALDQHLKLMAAFGGVALHVLSAGGEDDAIVQGLRAAAVHHGLLGPERLQ